MMARPRNLLARAGHWMRKLRMGWSSDLVGMLGLRPGATDVAQPMAQNAAVYSGIRAIAQTVGGFPLVLHREGATDRLIESGPAWELLRRPAPGQTTSGLVEQIIGHLVEGGEAHVLPERGLSSGAIRGLSVAGYRQMNPQRDPLTGLALWWNYVPLNTARRQEVLPEDDFYLRLFNPHDALRGLGPLKAAALGIRQDYAASLYNVSALDNGAAPGGLIAFPGQVTEEQAREYTRRLEERTQGADRANRVIVVGGGADYKQTAWKNTDLDLFTGRKFSRDEIFNAMGVPSVIVAIFESAHYDVADKSIEIFLTFTIAPLVRSLEALLNTIVLPQIEAGVEAHLDLTHHPVLQRILYSKIAVLRDAVATGVPYNEAVAFCGLPFREQEWGDVSLLQTGFAPATEIAAGLTAPPEQGSADGAAGSAEDEEPNTPDEETEDSVDLEDDPAEDARLAATIASEQRVEERQIRNLMPTLRQRLRALWLDQERRIVARLRRALAERDAGGAAWTPRPTEKADAGDVERLIARVLLTVAGEAAKYRKLLTSFFPRAIADTLRQELKRLGVAEDKIGKLVEQIKRGATVRRILALKDIKVTNIELTTRNLLRRALTKGLQDGETIQQLANRVHEVLGGNRVRALTIARTEAGASVSTARFAAASAAGATGKYWVTGANPRGSHILAGRTYTRTSPVAMDAPFIVGNAALMYPRDPSGPPGEIINCNCILISVRLNPGGAAQIVNIIGASGRRVGAERQRAA